MRMYTIELRRDMMSCIFFFFFKQKTAYEMRISDWSSDVCSSDLAARAGRSTPAACTSCRSTHRAPMRTESAGRLHPTCPRTSTSAATRRAAMSCGRWRATWIRRNRDLPRNAEPWPVGARAWPGKAAPAHPARHSALRGLRVPHLAVTAHHPALDGQRLQAHRPVRVQARGGDADLRAQPPPAPALEPRRGVDPQRRTADRAHEAVGRGLVGGGDHLGVVGGMALDVGDGVVDRIDHAHRD